ncbi:NAD-dependent protein deacetylase sirtuin-3-like isoform X2 [Carcharodon carcharias]|uniref:NAD-dependent protein deacetylase sirtuin-3-like isoform X2 n=1 Tax=Carcharodon carcharias TaxID=13397 RepID=UPI001B7E93D0|nr:NAD-dependent protein deacetylase sirtuin-3-like isoform X2 [Carcharodon carcharias]
MPDQIARPFPLVTVCQTGPCFFFLNTRFIDGMKHYLCVPPPSTVLRAPAVLLHAHLEQNKLMINPLEIADSMSFALYHSLAWTQPGLFASRWLQFNHSCIRNFQTGIRVGLSTCRQAHSKTSRNRCVNLPSATPSVRYIFSGKGSDDRVQSLEDIARLIQNKECSRIVVMSGAGISTPSGIPDFRSSGSGLYDNLQQYDIPYPEAIFEINYFFHNPKPFFALAKQLYPGNCKPNFTHYFVRFLHQKELLLRMYTQNIDGLERMAGIPPEKLVEAHGTFATATCTVCLENFSWEQLREDIMERKVPHCPSCSGVIKPDIVFFGEQLPANFHRYIIDLPSADLLIILGTSLENLCPALTDQLWLNGQHTLLWEMNSSPTPETSAQNPDQDSRWNRLQVCQRR